MRPMIFNWRYSALTAGLLGLAMIACLAGPAKADRLDEMISPVSDPINFEDPRVISEIRPVFLYHKIDDKFITNGGQVIGGAVQVRFAVDERLAIIATKDGYLHVQSDTTLPDGHGFANLAAGVKYAVYLESDAGDIITTGLRFEVPTGEREVLQGNGDGVLNPFVSAATALGPVNLMAYTALRLPSANSDSTFYDFDLHVSTPINEVFYPTLELNLHHVLDAGTRLPIADEGADFFNLGASESDGNTLVTGAVGMRARICPDLDAGVSYQFPLNSGDGTRVFEWRITTDMIYRFNV